MDTARELLTQLLQGHQGDADRLLEDLLALVNERTLAAGEPLLRAGQRARWAGLVLDGVMGEFYESPEGQRHAKWLARRGDVVGSLEDLLRDGPSLTSIEALTPVRLLLLPYAGLQQLARQDLAWARFHGALVEGLYQRKSAREYTLLMLRAEQRYQRFCTEFGELESTLPQHVVAAYLGISPVHLSRVRAALRARSDPD